MSPINRILFIAVLVTGITLIAHNSQSQLRSACIAEDTRPECDPNRINTLGWEDSPFISPDGTRLYFMYTPWNFFRMLAEGVPPEKLGPDRPGHHTNGYPFDDADIYVSQRNPDGTWSPPVNLQFNGYRSDCCGMLSGGGTQFYYNSNETSFTGAEPDIHVIEKGPDGTWGRPTNLGPPVNRGASQQDMNPHISSDGKTIYFSSYDRIAGYGKNDLYYSTKNPDGTWSEPINMGPNINTDRNEDQIWVSEDGKVAYFNREGVAGKFTGILRSEFNTGQWSPPEVVDFGTSPIIGEVSLTRDGKEAYFMVVDLSKQDTVLVYSELQPDGSWGQPKPVD